MDGLHKKLVTDEDNRPVAVQIDYSDWVALESQLAGSESKLPKVTDLSAFSGVLSVSEDPLEYQARIRGEW
jgi:hypothetical protein